MLPVRVVVLGLPHSSPEHDDDSNDDEEHKESSDTDSDVGEALVVVVVLLLSYRCLTEFTFVVSCTSGRERISYVSLIGLRAGGIG